MTCRSIAVALLSFAVLAMSPAGAQPRRGADAADAVTDRLFQAQAHLAAGRFLEAEAEYAKARAGVEAILAEASVRRLSQLQLNEAHGLRTTILVGSARTAARLGKPQDAVRWCDQMLVAEEARYGADNYRLATPLVNCASVLASVDRHAAALGWSQRALSLLTPARALAERTIGLEQFDRLVVNIHQMHARLLLRADASPRAAAQSLHLMQDAIIPAASRAIRSFATRDAAEASTAARLVRRYEVTLAARIAEWRRSSGFGDPARTPVLVDLSPKELLALEAKAVRFTNPRLRELDAELDRLRREIDAAFPAYWTLSQQSPVALEELQAMLRDDEVVLVLALTLGDDTNVKSLYATELVTWAVTRRDLKWHRAAIDERRLDDDITAVQCALMEEMARSREVFPQVVTDANGVPEPRDVTYSELCRQAVGEPPPTQGPMRFKHEKAVSIYRQLLGPHEALLADGNGKPRTLILVPSPRLQGFPFQALLPADGGSDDKRRWLGLTHPISILPSLAALKALRTQMGPSKATEPYVAFANPALSGGPRHKDIARVARSWTSCAAVDMAICNERFPATKRSLATSTSRFVEWDPMPQSACEVCAIGGMLGLNREQLEQAVHLGPRMTEEAIRSIGTAKQSTAPLRKFRIVHFATHAASARVLGSQKQPGLVLSPPGGAKRADDGYLTPPEIAELEMDADLVILSACSTGSGGPDDVEAFSGLARAFFQAGARSVLATRWEVNTNAAVDLTTRMFRARAESARITKAEAHRRAIEEMLTAAAAETDPATRSRRQHPAYWGAFTLVGDPGVAN